MDSSKYRKELSFRFGNVLSDEPLMLECLNMCQIFNMTPDDLFFKWEAMTSNPTAPRANFTVDSAMALKALIQRDLAAESLKKQQARTNLAGRMSRGRAPAFGLTGRLDASMPVAASPMRASIKLERAVVAGPSKVAFVGPKNDPSAKKKRAYRYMYEKISDRSEVLDDRIDEFAEIVRQHYDISEFGDPASTTEEETTVIGRIVLDSESTSGPVKLNEASISLESSRLMGSGVRIPLRFDPHIKIRGATAGVGGIGLFPGAIVALRGNNGGGGWFLVTEILSIPVLKKHTMPQDKALKPDDDPVSLFLACGPYTSDTDLDYKPWSNFARKLKSSKPAVVILLGPFVDSGHARIKSGDIDVTPAQIFRERFLHPLSEFLDASPSSSVFIVPSTRDILSDHPVFPQCELPPDLAGDPRIRLLPNPCLFSLNGIAFAVSSVDVLFHLRKEEFFKRAEEVESKPTSSGDLGSDAMANLCRHLLQQRSFYPIFPVPLELSHDVNLDVSHSANLRLGGEDDDEYAPDVLVIPSRLKQFSKVIDDTVVVNPSFLSKGTYALLNLASHKVDSLKEQIMVDLVKLNADS